jgi:hypothetical protein
MKLLRRESVLEVELQICTPIYRNLKFQNSNLYIIFIIFKFVYEIYDLLKLEKLVTRDPIILIW